MQTLEDYRIQVVRQLRACRDAAGARALLAEVDLVLTHSRISDHTQRGFWKALNDDLDVVAQEAAQLVDKNLAAALGLALTAARDAILEYEVLTGSDEPRP